MNGAECINRSDPGTWRRGEFESGIETIGEEVLIWPEDMSEVEAVPVVAAYACLVGVVVYLALEMSLDDGEPSINATQYIFFPDGEVLKL